MRIGRRLDARERPVEPRIPEDRPMPDTPIRNFRLTPKTVAQIKQIAAEKHGLTATAGVPNAIDLYHRSMFSRRSADMTPVTVRPGGRTKGTPS